MEDQCNAKGCGKPRFCKGLCKTHYHKQYNAAHREKRNRYQREYHAAHREERTAAMRVRYAADPETQKERNRRWRAENPEAYKAQQERYRQENLERLRAYDASPERRAKKAARKRTRYQEWKLGALLVYGDGSCADCGYRPDNIFELEIHHVNHDGASHRASVTGLPRGGTFQFYKNLAEAGFPRDVLLATLCANCHKKRTLAHQQIN